TEPIQGHVSQVAQPAYWNRSPVDDPGEAAQAAGRDEPDGPAARQRRRRGRGLGAGGGGGGRGARWGPEGEGHGGDGAGAREDASAGRPRARRQGASERPNRP